MIIPDAAESVVLDREQAFLLFVTFSGDIEQTALASGMRNIDVLRMVQEDGWLERLKPILELQKSQRPGDFARGVNRAQNFVQARKFWLFLERVVSEVCALDAQGIREKIFQTDEKGHTKFQTRALADLATAIEKMQALTYLATSDTAQDRARRQEQANGSTDANASELHIRIAAAMSRVKHSSTPRAQVFDAKLEIAQAGQKETETNGHNSSR